MQVAKIRDTDHERQARLPASDTKYERSLQDGFKALERAIEQASRMDPQFPSIPCARFALLAIRQLHGAVSVLRTSQTKEGTLELLLAAVALGHAQRESSEFGLAETHQETAHRFESCLSDLILS